MAGIRQTFDKDGTPHPKWRYWYKNWQGERVWETGTEDPKRTQRVAVSIEADHARIREDVALGRREPPTSADIAKPRPIQKIFDEYLAWGKAQGGHGGRAWSAIHYAMRKRHMKFWTDQLGLKSMIDISLSRVELVARDLLKKKTGKTAQLHVESIKSFVIWSKKRGYLEKNILEGIGHIDTTPASPRRALTQEEFEVLLAVAPPERRLIYETALCTGYRTNELRSLKVHDLDVKTGTLSLSAAFCKGRKDSRQPIPNALAAKLSEACTGKAPSESIFEIGSHLDRLFKRDYEAAGIKEKAFGGKLVFHGLRHTYCNLTIESGANVKEAQTMLRHSDPKLTMNIYASARPHSLHERAEAIGERVMKGIPCATDVQRLAAGAESTQLNADGEVVCGNEILNCTGVRTPSPALVSTSFKPLPSKAFTSKLSAPAASRCIPTAYF